ncbi:hypothetical protein E2C01_057250 [Portunus trituberculatus]|uniref:Uncharacterized protein n=1 Tax=Portunus trituberculatus TaxID=210409 RepID=A0A5B7GZZ7_PORTR|nr:hypothetical protein [Portunus trituberculatus]
MIAVVFEKQDQLIVENKELNEKCDKLENKVKMKTLDEIKRENSALKAMLQSRFEIFIEKKVIVRSTKKKKCKRACKQEYDITSPFAFLCQTGVVYDKARRRASPQRPILVAK